MGQCDSELNWRTPEPSAAARSARRQRGAGERPTQARAPRRADHGRGPHFGRHERLDYNVTTGYSLVPDGGNILYRLGGSTPAINVGSGTGLDLVAGTLLSNLSPADFSVGSPGLTINNTVGGSSSTPPRFSTSAAPVRPPIRLAERANESTAARWQR